MYQMHFLDWPAWLLFQLCLHLDKNDAKLYKWRLLNTASIKGQYSINFYLENVFNES